MGSYAPGAVVYIKFGVTAGAPETFSCGQSKLVGRVTVSSGKASDHQDLLIKLDRNCASS